MAFLTPKLAVRLGGTISGVGLMLALVHPFGIGDAVDLAQGLVIGVGFGLTIGGLLKGRRGGPA